MVLLKSASFLDPGVQPGSSSAEEPEVPALGLVADDPVADLSGDDSATAVPISGPSSSDGPTSAKRRKLAASISPAAANVSPAAAVSSPTPAISPAAAITLIPFTQLSVEQKKEKILNWIAPNRQGTMVNQAEILKKLPYVLSDPIVDISLVKSSFSRGTYMMLLFRLKSIKEAVVDNEIPCSSCGDELSNHTKGVSCDLCLMWFHSHCAFPGGSISEEQFWFCLQCRSRPAV